MANLYLVFDEQATNKTPHIVPKCYDAKQQETNSSSTVTLINYQSADGGIPVNFGLNILGWMVSETLVSVVEYLNLIFFALLYILATLFRLFGLFSKNENNNM